MNKPRVFWTSIAWQLPAMLAGIVVLSCPVSVIAQVRLDEADRFARLLTQTAYRPSAMEIERDYLSQASPALHDLLDRNQTGALQLQAAVSSQRFAYRHALELCLPAIHRIKNQVDSWLMEVADGLGVPDDAGTKQVVALFGAGTTGGMVEADRIVIALEVQCRFANSEESAEQVLEAAIRHEAVHVHQLRRQLADARNSLLRQAMIEGLADWFSTQQLGAVPPQARERTVFGEAHEAYIWQQFRDDMNGDLLGHWMYGPGRPGEPADLGYWIGSQIVAAYMAQAHSQSQPESSALQTLLTLESPELILDASGYAPATPMPPAPAPNQP